MKLLLDTHVVVWWAQGDSRIRGSWVEAITDSAHQVHVSAASAWELETKKRLGKLRFPFTVVELVAQFGFQESPVTVEQATLAGALDWGHRDPFDRMLVAQSLSEGFTLVSADPAIAAAPGVSTL